MAQLTTEALAAPPEIVYQVAPAAAVGLAAAQALVYEVTDPVLAELARLRMGQLLGDERGSSRRSSAARERGLTEDKIVELTHWPRSDRFSARERPAWLWRSST
jgi:alkylhydroperoxidase family enzyme